MGYGCSRNDRSSFFALLPHAQQGFLFYSGDLHLGEAQPLSHLVLGPYDGEKVIDMDKKDKKEA